MNIKLRAIRTLFNFLANENHIPYRLQIKQIKQDANKIHVFSQEDIIKIVAPPNFKTCNFVQYRNWVICCTFLSMGCRVTSLLNTRIEDVDPKNKNIMFWHSKNRQPYGVPISPEFEKILRHYLRVRGGEKSDFLFPNQFGDQMTRRAMESAVKDHCVARGIDPTKVRCSPHTFRHTLGTESVEMGWIRSLYRSY